MSNDKIVNMADKTKDATKWTPIQALNYAVKDIGDNGSLEKGKKILIISLDDTDENYDVGFTQAGMTMGECIALCEVAKAIFLTKMNYI